MGLAKVLRVKKDTSTNAIEERCHSCTMEFVIDSFSSENNKVICPYCCHEHFIIKTWENKNVLRSILGSG